MREIDIEEAAASLSSIVEGLARREEVVLTRGGRGVARLTGLPGKQTVRFGVLEGQLDIPDDFDAPLPDEVRALFEGR